MISRKQRMNGEVTHEEFYGQFVNETVKLRLLQGIGRDRILNSRDVSFNDIRNAHWDALPTCAGMSMKMKEAGTFLSHVDKLCIYKEAARQIRAEQSTPKRHAIRLHFKETNETLDTDINGTVDSIHAYYMQDGGKLNIGQGGQDRMVTVREVTFLDRIAW